MFLLGFFDFGKPFRQTWYTAGQQGFLCQAECAGKYRNDILLLRPDSHIHGGQRLQAEANDAADGLH